MYLDTMYPNNVFLLVYFFLTAILSKPKNLIKGHQSWCTKQLAHAIWLANIVKQIHVSSNKAAHTLWQRFWSWHLSGSQVVTIHTNAHVTQRSLTLLSFNIELSTNIEITGTVDNPISTDMLLAYLVQIWSKRPMSVLILYSIKT